MTENFQQNVSIPLVVELGRLPLSLQQVGELQKDQVLQLTQGPGSPVELMVGDKSIGQGEVVEVEGKLGIKILSIAGV